MSPRPLPRTALALAVGLALAGLGGIGAWLGEAPGRRDEPGTAAGEPAPPPGSEAGGGDALARALPPAAALEGRAPSLPSEPAGDALAPEPARRREPRITGRVAHEDGRPARGARLKAWPLDEAGAISRELASGIRIPFEIATSEAGDFHAPLEDAWGGMQLAVSLAGMQRLQRVFRRDRPDQDLDAGVLVLPTPGALEGRVAFPRGAQPERWSVTLMPRDDALPEGAPLHSLGTTRFDGQGSFRFPEVPPGTVELVVAHPFTSTSLRARVEIQPARVTRFTGEWSGGDPDDRLELVAVLRDLRADQVWIEDEHGRIQAPSEMNGFAAVFRGLGRGTYSGFLALPEKVLRLDGLRRGESRSFDLPRLGPRTAIEVEGLGPRRLRADAHTHVLTPERPRTGTDGS